MVGQSVAMGHKESLENFQKVQPATGRVYRPPKNTRYTMQEIREDLEKLINRGGRAIHVVIQSDVR